MLQHSEGKCTSNEIKPLTTLLYGSQLPKYTETTEHKPSMRNLEVLGIIDGYEIEEV
jgi:hypothetical protein